MKRKARLAVVLIVAILVLRSPAATLVLVVLLVLGLVFALRRFGWLRWPHAGWHECEMCRYPIEPPSRARFCSPGCRRRHRLEQRAPLDDRAAGQLRALERGRVVQQDYGDVPF